MKRLITLICTAVLFATALISYLAVRGSVEQVPAFGKGYAVVRVFDKDGFTAAEISEIRYAAENASTAEADDKGRLWCDAYSYFTKAAVSRPNRDEINCRAIVTGGDFFLFHDIDFETGWYYTDTDLHRDRVVIDEKLAFELFGSNDVEDMTLTLGGKTLYVAGVTSVDETKAKELQLETDPIIYLPSHIAEELFGEAVFDNYEIMMQNPVDSYAVNALSQVSGEKQAVDVTNRYKLKNTFKLLKNFYTRSYRTDGVVYPYWENCERGMEDVLALLVTVNILTFTGFAVSLILFILERKRS